MSIIYSEQLVCIGSLPRIKSIKVVFPLPVVPLIPTKSPLFIVRLNLLIIILSLDGYLKFTSTNFNCSNLENLLLDSGFIFTKSTDGLCINFIFSYNFSEAYLPDLIDMRLPVN